MDRLIATFRKKIHKLPAKLQRGLIDEIQWNAKLIGIKGARGVGKTTLLLQYIKLHLKDQLDKTLYVTLDDLWFSENTLVDLVERFEQNGGRYLFLDEVHKYENWSQELKNIYDLYPDIQVVFTGSSLLEILNARADLSRRAIVYNLQGLSFREFLTLHTEHHFQKFTIHEILSQHVEIASEIQNKIKPLPLFRDYLKYGYFPFHLEQPDLYFIKLKEVINLVLEIELPQLRNINLGYIQKLKQLLYIISQSVPFTPNIVKLSERMGIDRKTLLAYFYYLDETQLIINLFKESGGISSLQKPQKVFLDNTNLMYAFANENINIGNVRETFFANQLRYHYQVTLSEKSDFEIDSKFTFEIGGKSKEVAQIQSNQNFYIAADNIEIGFGNKIPLWLFGMMY